MSSALTRLPSLGHSRGQLKKCWEGPRVQRYTDDIKGNEQLHLAPGSGKQKGALKAAGGLWHGEDPGEGISIPPYPSLPPISVIRSLDIIAALGNLCGFLGNLKQVTETF